MLVARPPRQVERKIHADLFCRSCGYNLRSLPESGKCPECATPVALSTRGELLEHAEPNWVASLARGATTVVYAISAVILALLLTVVAAFSGYPIDWPLAVVGLLSAIALLVGQWLITRPEPSAPGGENRTTGRTVVRWLLLVTLAYVGLKQLTSLLGPIQLLPGVGVALEIVLTTLIVCWLIAYSRHLAWLCERIPDRKRATLVRRLGVILAALLIAESVTQGIPPIAASLTALKNATGFGPLIELLLLLIPLGMVICGVRAVLWHHAIARKLRNAAHRAGENWTSATSNATSNPEKTPARS
jgi:hypothetical protein